MKVAIHIVREFVKGLLVAFYWAFPIYLQQTTGIGKYLWLFIVSFLLTGATLDHYETLSVSENLPRVGKDEEHHVRVEDLYPKRED